MMDELGAGFYLAMHDLEIRGAGEVLGENQSGEMQEVGFNLYTEMLKRAVSALKQGKEPDLLQPLAASPPKSTCTPRRCCPTTTRRTCTNADALQAPGQLRHARRHRALQEELVDRFGELPPQAQSLLESHRLRLLCKPLGITKLDATA
jgi:transcription-repair coupling factor (superfamily II helicase)